jgi:DNA-binding transcriptional ArsR family regulator
MSIDSQVPDYELADEVHVSSPAELRAIADPLRGTILELLLERAATVTELAHAVGRPKSTVAHHVNVLVGAGMLRVVRTRRVRAIEERYYGRTSRIFYIDAVRGPGDAPTPSHSNYLSSAASESMSAYESDRLSSIFRHARIPKEKAGEFWTRVVALTQEFTRIPRSGDTVFGFVAGIYPTNFPSLPESDPEINETGPAS